MCNIAYHIGSEAIYQSQVSDLLGILYYVSTSYVSTKKAYISSHVLCTMYSRPSSSVPL